MTSSTVRTARGLFAASALIAATIPQVAGAQAPVTPPAAPGSGSTAGATGGTGGRGGTQTAAPGQLDLATAKRIAVAAEAAAAAANARVAIAVVDANGDLVYLQRIDGAAGRPVTSAQAKARSAILFGVPTKAVADAVAAGTPLSAKLTPSGVGTFEISFNQGGLPIVRDGKVIGGVGVGGSTSANDEAFARAGLDALAK